MKEFIDKLIARLEELADKEGRECDKAEKFGLIDIVSEYNHGQYCYINAISIVNQLAEEYKGGWIPCSERLPDVFDNVLICTKEGGRTIGHRCPNQENGRYYDLHSSPIDDVIAWQHLPQPYMASIRSGLKINESEEKRNEGSNKNYYSRNYNN